MKILYITKRSFEPNAAGVQRTTYRLGKYFTEKGLDVAYFSDKHTGHTKVEFGELFHVPYEGGLKQSKNLEYFDNMFKMWEPSIVINQMPYDKGLRKLLHNQKGKRNFYLVACLHNTLFTFLSNIRFKIKMHSSKLLFYFLDNKIAISIIKYLHILKHKKELKSILDIHDKFVLLAPQNRDELFFFVKNYKMEKTIVIPNSIPKVFSKALEKKKKIILSVGTLNIEQKRADLLLKFWEIAHNRLPNWDYIIVGDGNYKDVMAKEIKDKNLPRITLTGRKIPEKYYEEASFFIMTSAYEGFPNTILEANSYGCPLVAFKTYAALNWIVNDGKDALLSDPFDLEHMIRDIEKVINKDNELFILQQNSLINAKRFTIEIVGAQWLKMFNQN